VRQVLGHNSLAITSIYVELGRRDLADFLDGLVSHYVLDEGKLVVAHAGLKETMHGRASREVRAFTSIARRRAKPTRLACPCATTGRPSTMEERRSSTATRWCRGPSG
jgi:hypothetical protein